MKTISVTELLKATLILCCALKRGAFEQNIKQVLIPNVLNYTVFTIIKGHVVLPCTKFSESAAR